MTSFIEGFFFAFKGIGLLNQKGIRPFVIMPVLINIILLIGIVYFSFHQFGLWMEQLINWLPSFLSFIEWFLYPLFTMLLIFAIVYGFTTLANFIAAPFNSLLAERLEQKLDGFNPPSFQGYKAIVGTISKTIASEIKKITYTLKLAILLTIVSFIPIIQIISPLLWGIFSVWILALEYADYPMGNNEWLFKAEKKLLAKQRGLSLGLGTGILVLTFIPVLNLIAMPAGVAAGTLFWVKQKKRLNLE